ncbi:MAG: glycoside hydrolase family 127 protein [Prevotella sp.]|nr:glycoside hydrolase family 127 protein [Prevotella sp.]
MRRIFLLFVVAASGLMAWSQSAGLNIRNIASTDPVRVTVLAGYAPQLPYQLWVTYTDGSSELRQVRWMNALTDVETDEADATKHPAGTEYEVVGYVVGDGATASGYPVMARVSVVSGEPEVPAAKPVCEPLPLNRVVLNGENRLTHNRDLDIDNLLSLDVRQQLYNYHDTYGLPTDGYPEADGWDSPTTKLKGHGSGHYMSALALAYAGCQDKQKRAQLLDRIKTMVDELRACQERTFVWNDSLGRYWEARDFAPEQELRQLGGTWADFDRYKQHYQDYGYGYLNAIPAQHCVLIEMYRAYNNEEWVWAPYYTVHKQLAGLIDIANYVDDKKTARKALLIAKDMGLWVWNRLHYRTFVEKSGTAEERRSRPGNRYEMWNMYIAGEVGGMAESLSRLSEMVADAAEKARLLEAASYFNSPAFFDPLARNIDAIRTRHANQHIPMVTGALRSYRGNADPYYYRLASNFWQMVQGRYRYAMGGVGNGEMFRQPYTQMLSMATQRDPTLNETCCAYNLAKLTKDLNCYQPDDARYMDYYERLLYNQLVGSVNAREYAVLYQYAVGLDASKPWGNETPQSTCCGGTGAENHVKYQEAAYFTSDNTMWVSLYLPTTATWDAKGIELTQDCQWPAEKSTIRITRGKGEFKMKLRVPYWATEGFDVKLNGQSVATSYKPCSYVEIPLRRWKKGDVVEVSMPYTQHLDFAPDKMEIDFERNYEPMWAAAIMRGPLVMGATGLKTWDEATLRPGQSMADLHLVADYDADRHVTHYFRIDAPVGQGGATDPSVLRNLMQMAKNRIDAQEAWNALEVKVPEHAPWAPNGYARMAAQYAQAGALLDAPDRAAEIDKTAAALNAALNTMRPGNLAEPEDLQELSQLVDQARELEKSDEVRRALRYAQMVTKYVNDGSGTHDMISRATSQLRELLEGR